MKRLGPSGAVKAVVASTEEAITSLTAAATALKHTNHLKDTKMQEAVKEWDEWDVDFLGTTPSKGDFAKHRGANKSTFYKYIKDDKAEHTMIGACVGPKSNISDNTLQFLMEHAVRADCADKDLNPFQIQQNIILIVPTLTGKQAENHYHRFM